MGRLLEKIALSRKSLKTAGKTAVLGLAGAKLVSDARAKIKEPKPEIPWTN